MNGVRALQALRRQTMNKDKYRHLVYMVAERLEGGTWKAVSRFTVIGIERLGCEDNAVPKLLVKVRQNPEVVMEKNMVLLLSEALAGTAGFRSGVEFDIVFLNHVNDDFKNSYIELTLRALEVDEEADEAEDNKEAEDA